MDCSKTSEIGAYGPLYLRKHHFKRANDVHPGKQHQFDHVSLVARGPISVTVGGIETVYETDDLFIVPAKTEHHIKALRDNAVLWCLFVLRDSQGEITSVFDGNVMRYS